MFLKSAQLYSNNEKQFIISNQILLNGFLTEYGEVTELEWNCSEEILQKTLLEALNKSNTITLEKEDKVDPLAKHLGIKSWKKAKSDKKLVMVNHHFDDDPYFKVTATKKMKNGAYPGIKSVEILEDEALQDNNLAKSVLKAMKLSII